MQIANPIYDAVFKFMMNDNEVAKLLLSAIIGEEIIDLQFHPTEIQIPLHESITVFRMDFKAVVQYKDGQRRVIIIEIQKAKLHTDIMRFRRYLGQQYIDKNNSIVTKVFTSKDGKKIEHREAIPILSIYFLGHTLNHAENIPVIKITRQYIDLATGEELTQKEEFIESLTHDSFIIQIPYIKGHQRTDLEQLLHIFDQTQVEDNNGQSHLLNVKEEDIPEQYLPILRRLLEAFANPTVRNMMIAEDELLTELQSYARQVENMKEEIEQNKQAIEQKDKTIEQKDKAIEQKDKAIEQKDKAIEQNKQEIEQKDKAIEQKDKAIEQKDKAIEQKDKAIENAVRKFMTLDMTNEEIAVILNIPVEKVVGIRKL